MSPTGTRTSTGTGAAVGSAGAVGSSGGGASASSPTTGGAAEPKQDRSRVTRQRLLEATVRCVAERGWAASTMAVIAAEAGISRGALQHHFPTREALVVAGLEHIFEERRLDLDRLTATVGAGTSSGTNDTGADETHPAESDTTETDAGRPDADGVHAVVVRLVEIYTGEHFRAALQVWSAAAADPALRETVLPLERHFARSAHAMAVAALGVDDTDPQQRALVQATLDLARGLGLGDLLTDDSRRRTHVVRAWSTQLAAALGR